MTTAADLVRKLHARPGYHKAVLAITGGGAEAVGELLRHGNGSATLLEAVVPYDQEAFNRFVRGKPDKYCSAGAARDLAMAAYIRATEISGRYDVVGIGASCSLKRDGVERAGRKHEVYIAFQNATTTGSFEYEITDINSTRESEETFAAEKIINALVEGFGYQNELGLIEHTASHTSSGQVTFAQPGWSLLLQKAVRNYKSKEFGGPLNTSKYIFPGAWNPIHTRHEEIMAKVHELTGKAVDLELCIRNVDKPPLNFYDLSAREVQLEAALAGKPYAGNLHLTTTATFAEKAEVFPDTTFIVGADTFLRIADLKYYGNDDKKRYEAIDGLRAAGCKFILFHRVINGKATTVEDIMTVPYYLTNLVERIITHEELPPNDVCSSNLRKKL